MNQLAPFLATPEPDADMVAAARRRFADGLPVIVPDFCAAAFAADLHSLFSSLTWERSHVLHTPLGGVEQVREDQFEAADPAVRFSRHDRAIALDAALNGQADLHEEALRTLRRLFTLSVASPALASWIERLCGTANLKACGLEFARYRHGDFIAPHTDTHSGRVCHLLIYLDPEAREDSGGSLCHGERDGDFTEVPPLFNHGVILPLQSHTEHWVTPWAASRTGRLTISLGYAKANL